MSDYIQRKRNRVIYNVCEKKEWLSVYNKSNMVVNNYVGGKFISTHQDNTILLQNSTGNNLNCSLNLALFEKLAAVSQEITQLTYNFSIGNFDYVYKNLTHERYMCLTSILYETRPEIFTSVNSIYNSHIIKVYTAIRLNIVRSFEGFMLSSTQYSNLVNTTKAYQDAKKFEEILKDMKKLQAYLDELKKNQTIFPDSTISVRSAIIKPIYLRYIELYGVPPGMNFDVDKMGKLEEEMNVTCNNN